MCSSEVLVVCVLVTAGYWDRYYIVYKAILFRFVLSIPLLSAPISGVAMMTVNNLVPLEFIEE